MAKLTQYGGPFGPAEAAHLLRRAAFGSSKDQLEKAVSDGLSATLDTLFAPTPMPAPPVNPQDGSQWVPNEGQVWTKTAIVGDQANPSSSTAYDISRGSQYYNNATKTWWVKNLIHGPVSIHEKLTLFWSNHFATEMTIVLNAIFSFELLRYLRTNAFGSVKDIAKRVTLDPAMLRYLNGNVNTKGSSNENYGRELQELFTIGKGPEVGPGDYTTYTETDVQAAARVLTGWRDFGARDLQFAQGDRDLRDNEPRNPPQFPDIPNLVFVAAQHDTTDKQFSARYGSRVIKGRSGATAGMQELDELLDMIFSRPETAIYIVKRLYRWFVASSITDEIMRDVIEPLASTLRSENYTVGPVLRTLLASEHFFDAQLRGSQLRSPADMIIGALRTIDTWTPPTDTAQSNRFYQGIYTALATAQMDLNEPPSVAGWEAYYQAPGYDLAWISTATLPLRNGYTDSLLVSSNLLGRKPVLDSPEFVKRMTKPDDSLALIDELNILFFANPFTETTRMQLAEEVLMNGGRYYEWAEVWNAWIENPSNNNLRTAVKTNLDRLFKYMFRMAEYQLG